MEEKIISWFKVVYNKIKYEQNPKLRDFLDDDESESFFSKLDKDTIVVLGWDWSMLEAVHSYNSEWKTFLWINFWNKWFLMNDKSILDKDTNFSKLTYPLLECEVWWTKELVLNEIDISSCFWRMVDLNISLKDNHSIDLMWDWLIISTPIWSSWYNLSLWWPITPHSLKSFILTPKAPWKPTKQSPIMLEDSEELYIKSNNNSSSIDIYIDWVLFKKIRNFEEEIKIKKSKKIVKMLFDYSKESFPYFKVLEEQGFKRNKN